MSETEVRPGRRPEIFFSGEDFNEGAGQLSETSDIENTFRDLAKQWRSDTVMLSSVTKKVMHPAYQQIIGMGREALPFILRDLEHKRGHWLWALHAITREDPAQPDDNFDAAVEAWLEWGKVQGFI